MHKAEEIEKRRRSPSRKSRRSMIKDERLVIEYLEFLFNIAISNGQNKAYRQLG